MLKRSMYLMLSPENKERKGRSSTGERSPSSSSSNSSSSNNNGWERSKERSKKQRPAATASGPGAAAPANRRKYRRVFRIRIRVTSRLHFLERLREMCVRLVMGTQASASASSKRSRAVSPTVKCDQSGYVRSLYCEDAVADCIKFIKQTAAAAESRSLVR